MRKVVKVSKDRARMNRIRTSQYVGLQDPPTSTPMRVVGDSPRVVGKRAAVAVGIGVAGTGRSLKDAEWTRRCRLGKIGPKAEDAAIRQATITAVDATTMMKQTR